MAQIGYGYGSEFQLLRFLGHHRHLIDDEILFQLHESGQINWLDFGFADRDKVVSGDDEIKGLSFLKYNNLVDDLVYESIMRDYRSYGINKIESWQNWDAVFVLNDVVYLVEAKAYVAELSSGNQEHGGKSATQILQYMKDQLPSFPVDKVWLKDYYQFGNRLATTALLNRHGVKCRTLCIFFCNGYLDKERAICKDATKEEFLKAIEKEKEVLKIYDANLTNLVAPYIFIDANPQK